MKQKILVLGFLIMMVTTVFAQNSLSIKGKVISKTDGEAIIGASILETGTTNGTISDFNGNFSLTIESSKKLRISYMGYKTVILKAKNGMIISLEEDTHLLNDVIVTGYATQKKADLTGAVAVVKIDDVKTTPVSDPMQALQGKVAGMSITDDGSPSSDATIRIRGIGTMNDNSPLYVIDGVPTKTGLHSLNANDIASIQVLKDAASASIYGARAANGVIIITTKTGKKGKVRVDFDASYTISQYSSHMDVCNTKQYGEALFRSYTNTGIDPNSNALSYQFDWNNEYNNPVLNSMAYGKYDGYIDSNKTMRASDTDWFDNISQTGTLQNYSVSVSNGTDKGSYLFSLGYKGNKGIIKYTDYSSLSARMNSSYKLFNDKVTIGENFALSRSISTDLNVQNLALQALSIIPVHTENGGWGGPSKGMNDRNNPVRLLYDNRNNEKKSWRIFGNAFVSIKPFKGLEIRSNFGLDYNQYNQRDLTYSYQNGYLSNSLTRASLTQDHSNQWTWSNTANYNFKIDKHIISALIGMELQSMDDVFYVAYKDGYAIESTDYMWPDAGTGNTSVTGIENKYTIASYFTKIDYKYDEKYLASFTLRRDGSSRFGSNNRYGIFPAVTMGWRISSEPFIANNFKWIDSLKLRASWGKTGNQDGIDNYASIGKWEPAYGSADPTWDAPNYTSYDMNGNGSGALASGYKQTQRSNLNLKWESTAQYNIGLDYSLFNQSIYGNIDMYWKKTSGILLSPSYIATVGEGGSQYVNGASMENKGLEFSLGYRKTFDNGLHMDVNGVFDLYRNKVTSVPESVINNYGGNGADDNIIGHTYDSRYGYVTDGLFKSQSEIDDYDAKYSYASGFIAPGLGRIRYNDVNHDKVIDENDQTWIYDPTPDFSYGINIALNWKNFDFTMFWQGLADVDYYNEEKLSTDFFSISETGSNKGVRMLNCWSESNPNSSIPALTYSNNNNEARFSTYFIENGAYLKLRTLQIGYTLNKNLLETLQISSCRVYINGRNLVTLDAKNFTATDPESTSWGYPIPYSLTAGVQISF